MRSGRPLRVLSILERLGRVAQPQLQQGRRGQLREMIAAGAVDLHEIALSEI